MRSTVRILLNVILILAGFLACYVEVLYLSVLPPRQGTTIPFTIRPRDTFNFNQEKAFRMQRMEALSTYVPLLTYVPSRAAEAGAELQALADGITSLRLQPSDGTRKCIEYVKTATGLDISEELAKKLLRFSDLGNLVGAVLTLEESILQGKIIEHTAPLKQKRICEVLYPGPSGIVTFPVTEIITLDAARAGLQKKIQQLFWQVDGDVRDFILSIARTTLKPNLVYDLPENNKRIAKIMNKYSSKVISYGEGEVLVPFRRILSENDLLLLSAYREDMEKDLFAKALWVFMAILLTVLFHSLVMEKVIKDEWRKDPPCHLFISLLIITVFLFKTFLLLTPLPLVALPFGALPLILVLLQSDKISAIWVTMTAAVLVTLFSGFALNALLFFSFAGMAAVMISLKVQRRLHIIFASLAIGAANVLFFLSFRLDWGILFSPASIPWISRLEQAFNVEALGTLAWAFFGGIAAGPLAMALLPLLEMGWHTASTFRLSRYADLQHPLLKELLLKAPATYQHTMSVAYLAQSVGEAIGANSLLLRIGAYYHDIGKVTNPLFFAENQYGKNPHDDLDPHESTRIIIDHVVNGEKIGKVMKLPQVVLDFIIQHHGTQAVEFFYSKAVKQNSSGKVQKKDFQYPGPKPQSVEAAVVMICDAVEATSRSLESPTRGDIEKMVRVLLVKRIADGQFDECHLSTGCLAQILRALVNSLDASFHSRVIYPWQEKQKMKIKLLRRRPRAESPGKLEVI